MNNTENTLIDKGRASSLSTEFKEFLKTEEGQKWTRERVEKQQFFDEHFSKEALESLGEGELRKLLQILWSFEMWTSKDYVFEEMLKSGIERIRKGFQVLLYSNKPLAERFDYVKKNVRMMGAAAISEILTHFDEECAIWNRRAREGLIFLGVPEGELPKSSQIRGKKYQDYCGLAKRVLGEVQSCCSSIQTLFDLDLLLFFISDQKAIKPEIPTPKAEILTDDFVHRDIIEQVAQLGDGLGFEVEIEFNVAPGSRIDALWRSRIANLGTISYAFEVHRRGNRSNAVLNLMRILKFDPSIQKVILVSSQEEIDAFRREISSLGEDFRNAVGYFEVSDLQQSLDHLDSLKTILDNLGLLSAQRKIE